MKTGAYKGGYIFIKIYVILRYGDTRQRIVERQQVIV